MVNYYTMENDISFKGIKIGNRSNQLSWIADRGDNNMLYNLSIVIDFCLEDVSENMRVLDEYCYNIDETRLEIGRDEYRLNYQNRMKNKKSVKTMKALRGDNYG